MPAEERDKRTGKQSGRMKTRIGELEDDCSREGRAAHVTQDMSVLLEEFFLNSRLFHVAWHVRGTFGGFYDAVSVRAASFSWFTKPMFTVTSLRDFLF